MFASSEWPLEFCFWTFGEQTHIQYENPESVSHFPLNRFLIGHCLITYAALDSIRSKNQWKDMMFKQMVTKKKEKNKKS